METPMTEARRTAIKKLIVRHRAEMAKDPGKARARLIKEGIYTRSGELSVNYGGTDRDKASRAAEKSD